VRSDQLNARWRRVQNLNFYAVFYTCLYMSSAVVIVGYMVVQAVAPDFKEVGATVVALLLGTYGFWKLLRLIRILHTHRRIVQGPIARCDEMLKELVPNDHVQRSFTINFLDRPLVHHIEPGPGVREARSHYLASVLFDDDFPGDEAPRVNWLRRTVSVDREDAQEAATLLALFIRFSLRSCRKELWSLIVQTHPLLTVPCPSESPLGRVSLGRMLRRIINAGSALPPPQHVLANPVEELINMVNGHATKKKDGTAMGLADIGCAFFWTAVEESADEVAQVVGKFPARWLRGTRLTGFDFVLESSMLLVRARGGSRQ
jgi:hypothetical protein